MGLVSFLFAVGFGYDMVDFWVYGLLGASLRWVSISRCWRVVRALVLICFAGLWLCRVMGFDEVECFVEVFFFCMCFL